MNKETEILINLIVGIIFPLLCPIILSFLALDRAQPGDSQKKHSNLFLFFQNIKHAVNVFLKRDYNQEEIGQVESADGGLISKKLKSFPVFFKELPSAFIGNILWGAIISNANSLNNYNLWVVLYFLLFTFALIFLVLVNRKNSSLVICILSLIFEGILIYLSFYRAFGILPPFIISLLGNIKKSITF